MLVGIHHKNDLVAFVSPSSKFLEKILVEAFPWINGQVSEVSNMLFPHGAKTVMQVGSPPSHTARFDRTVCRDHAYILSFSFKQHPCPSSKVSFILPTTSEEACKSTESHQRRPPVLRLGWEFVVTIVRRFRCSFFSLAEEHVELSIHRRIPPRTVRFAHGKYIRLKPFPHFVYTSYAGQIRICNNFEAVHILP